MGATKNFRVLGRDITITEIANILNLTKATVYKLRYSLGSEDEFIRVVTKRMEDKGFGTNELGEALEALRNFKMSVTHGKYQESDDTDDLCEHEAANIEETHEPEEQSAPEAQIKPEYQSERAQLEVLNAIIGVIESFMKLYTCRSVPVESDCSRLLEKLKEERFLSFRSCLKIDWDKVAQTIQEDEKDEYECAD